MTRSVVAISLLWIAASLIVGCTKKTDQSMATGAQQSASETSVVSQSRTITSEASSDLENRRNIEAMRISKQLASYMEDPQVAGHDVAVIGGALHLPASRLWAQTGDVLYVKMEALHVACDAVYFDNPHDENGRSIGAGKKLDQSLFNQLVFHWHSSTYTEKLPKDCSGGPDTQIFYKIQVSIKGKPVTADILDTYGDGSIPDGSYYRVGGDVYHDNGGGTQRVSEPPLSAVLDSFKDAEKAHPEK